MKKLLQILLLVVVVLISGSLKDITAEIVKVEDYVYYQEAVMSQIVAGKKSMAAITEEGRLYTWGDNEYGQLGIGNTTNQGTPQDITNSLNLATGEYVTQVAIGPNHMLALSSENRLFGWGWNNAGEVGDNTRVQRTSPVEITANFSLGVDENVIDIAAGFSTGFVITDAGTIYTWGLNNQGQLGKGDTASEFDVTDHTSYYSLETEEEFTDLDIQNGHVLGLTNLGNLYAWGSNSSGQLGVGTTTSGSSAVNITANLSITEGESITTFNAGNSHSVVTITDGTVLTFGENGYGQIGDGTSVDRTSPTDITSSFVFSVGEYVVAADAHSHNLVVTSLGRVFAWGYNNVGQTSETITGEVNTPLEKTSAFDLDALEAPGTVATGYLNSYMISNQSNLFAWGDNDLGQLAIGECNGALDSRTPVKLPRDFDILNIKSFVFNNVVKVSSDAAFNMALTDNGMVYTWGSNAYGQLGSGNTVDKSVPYNVTPNITLNEGEEITDIATGITYSIVLTSEYRIFAWGSNTYGQFGNGTTTDELLPIDITSFIPLGETDYITNIYTGGLTTILTSNLGKVYTFGYNTYGNLGIGTTAHSSSPIDITDNFNFDVDEELVSVESSMGHVLALTNQNNLYSWGNNSGGQLGDGSSITKKLPIDITSNLPFSSSTQIVDIEVGSQYSGLVNELGEIYTWGFNSNGALGEGTSISRYSPYEITNQFSLAEGELIIELDIGISHSFAITDLGNSFSWGLGLSGQLGEGYKITRSYPTDVTSNLDLGSETASKYILGEKHSIILTDGGSLYSFGESEHGELGVGEIVDQVVANKITKNTSDLSEIRFLDMYTLTATTATYLRLEIYPSYDIAPVLTSITIDSVVYDTSDFIYDGGMITVNIPNIYIDGDTPEFTIELFTFSDATSAVPTGPVDIGTTVAVDNVGPVFDLIGEQIIEGNIGMNIDWTTYMENVTDNFDGIITLEETDYVIYDILGSYTVTVTATDEAGNTSSETFDVYVEDLTAPELSYTGPYTFELGDPLIDFASFTIATDSFEGDLSIAINITHSIDRFVAGTYTVNYDVFDSSNNYNVDSFDITVVDTVAPTFDSISTQTVELGTSDIDWTTYILNPFDLSTTPLNYYEFSDTVNYNVVGSYSVTVQLLDISLNNTIKTFTVNIVDTVAPVFDNISTQTVEVGSNNIDWTTIVTGAIDNSGTTVTLIETDLIDYDIIGPNLVTMTAYDESGNEYSQVFEVNIVDTTVPTFDIVLVHTIELGTADIDWTTMLTNLADNSSGVITTTEVDDYIIYDTVGSYEVLLRIEDESGNDILVTIEVIVEDTTAPTFDVIEDQLISSVITDYDWTLLIVNLYDASTTPIILEVVSSDVIFGTIGTYGVTVSATDASGNVTSYFFNVIISDSVPPEITLNDLQTIYIEFGDSYTEAGAQCTDDIDLTCEVVITGSVNESSLNTYIITYTATDSTGNTSYIERTVVVRDTVSPVLSLNASVDTVYVGDIYIDQLVTVYDNSATTWSVNMTVDTSTVGRYIIVYTVTDTSGNVSTISRVVNVVDNNVGYYFEIAPTITTVEINSSYTHGTCNLIIGEMSYACSYDNSNLDINSSGVYFITYFVEVEGITYSQKVYVFVYSDGDVLVLYYDKKEWEVLI